MGPARGTLTTTADTDSVAGTVVKDTQTIAVATVSVSQSTRFGLASDTVRVPWTDITTLLPAQTISAWFMVGMRVVGSAPSNAQASATHLSHRASGLSVAVGWGRDTTHLQSMNVWKSVWGDQYRITGPALISTSSMTGTNMVIRAWGITGGSIELDLDVIYVMPQLFDIPDLEPITVEEFPSDFKPMQFGNNGTMSVDEDNDPADNAIDGHHTVTFFGLGPGGTLITGGAGSVMEGVAATVDMQSANDETTAFNINANGDWCCTPYEDPRSFLSLVAAPIYLPAQSFISDSFPNSHISDGSSNPVVSTPQDFAKTLFAGNFFSENPGDGVSEDSGSLRARLTGFQPAPAPTGSSFWPACAVAFGNAPLITGDTNTPDKQHPMLYELEDSIQTFSFSVSTLGNYRILCGQTDYSPTPDVGDSNGAFIEMDGGGNLTLSLVSQSGIFIPSLGGSGVDARNTIDGPVTITTGFSSGVTFWCKVEHRRYHWRAKCWEDGTGEPDWQVEGFQYLVATATGGTNPDWVAEPYNTNWVGDANHDLVRHDPTNTHGFPFIMFEPDFSQPQVDISVFQYDLEVDPHGANPADVTVVEEKYDGTEDESVALFFASKRTWRFIEGTLKHRHFNTDVDGFNLRSWKSAGGPELQYSCIPIVWERGILQSGVIPLYRPRVFSVSTP